ncbi:hypothetical protein V5O48_012592 [Marasmius crinis-equi]|uniref:Uncharacterized protein n=1 Tax=Marasmius crinis-equi TaxID=585013 RepID=A0ABR3F2S0_9AGAR
MAVDLIEASLASLPIESVLFGLFLLLATISLYVISQHEKNKKGYGYNKSNGFVLALKNPIFVGGIILLAMATLHWITSIIRTFDAFLYYPAPILFYIEVSHWTQLVKNCVLSGSAALSDAVIIYRLWVVWNRRISVVILPFLSIIATTLAGIVAAYLFRVSKPGEDIYSGAISKWVTSQIALTLWTNIYCSVFIAGRIWHQKRQSAAYAVTNASSPLSRVLIIFIESATFYALWIIAFAITYFTKSPLAFIFSDSWACVAGMTFLSINARIFLTSTKSHGGNSSYFSGPLTSSSQLRATQGTESYGMAPVPVAVSVTRAQTATVETDDGKEGSRWNAV